MRIEQLLAMRSKEEACFIIYSKCYHCSQFYENEWGNWNCISPWHEKFCRKSWEKFLNKVLDKNEKND